MHSASVCKMTLPALAGAALALCVIAPSRAEDKAPPDPLMKALHTPTEQVLNRLGAQWPHSPAEPGEALSDHDDEHLSLRERATRVLGLIDSAAEGDPWARDGACSRDVVNDRPGLCNLRWRKTDALSEFRSRYQRTTHAMKSRVVGKGLADHLEVDLDTSPEIKFKWEWD